MRKRKGNELDKLLSVYVPKPMHDEVKEKCDNAGITLTYVIRRALLAWIASPSDLPFFIVKGVEDELRGISGAARRKKDKEAENKGNKIIVWDRFDNGRILPIPLRWPEEEDSDEFTFVSTGDTNLGLSEKVMKRLCLIDEAGNLFDDNGFCIDPKTGELCREGKPKWWKEKSLG